MSEDKNKMKSSKYTREFRDSSVQLVINSEESTAKIAKDLDVNDKTLYYPNKIGLRGISIC